MQLIHLGCLSGESTVTPAFPLLPRPFNVALPGRAFLRVKLEALHGRVADAGRAKHLPQLLTATQRSYSSGLTKSGLRGKHVLRGLDTQCN